MNATQRVVSGSTGLCRLSIVEKREQSTQGSVPSLSPATEKGDNELSSSAESQESPRKCLSLKSPLCSPRRSSPQHSSSPLLSRMGHSDLNDVMPDDLLHRLAAKKGRIQELQLQLRHAQKELRALEDEVRHRSKRELSPTRQFGELIQRKIETVGKNPAILRSRKSISHFFQESLHPAGGSAATVSATDSSAETDHISSGVSAFLGKLKNKLQELKFDEEDEREFDEARNVDQFYHTGMFDYDSEEEELTQIGPRLHGTS